MAANSQCDDTMSNALPMHVRTSTEVEECLQECANEPVSFISSEAPDKCAIGKREIVNGEDTLVLS
jgi:nuclear transcription Y subunit beta